MRYLLCSFYLIACAGESDAVTEGGVPDGAADGKAEAAPMPSELPLPELAPCEPTFESIRETILVPTCGLPVCHLGTDAAYVQLVPEDAHEDLVGVPAACVGWTRVVPGDPDASYLWRKVTADDPECGDRMPWGYEPLPEAALDCIRQWIEGL